MGSTTEEMAAISDSNPRQCKRPRTKRLEELGASSDSSVGINIADSFVGADYRLLQAPDEVVAALTKGERVRVVGSSEDQRAVLVTADSTYELCRVETSNMMLLLPPVAESESEGLIVGNVGYHYEVKKVPPKFEELQRLLASSSMDEEPQGVTLEELECRVQGSQEEIRAKLVEMKAMEVDGRWFVVSDRRVLTPVLDRVLTEALVASIDLRQPLSVSQCAAMVSDVRPLLLRQCLQLYGTAIEQGDAQGEPTYLLDLDKVAQVKAHMVFKQGLQRPQKAVWSKSAFLAEWEAVMPCTHPLTDALLQGIALNEPAPSGEASWRYLPAEELDLNPELRLRSLFETRKAWALADLEPYLREVLPDKVKLEDFLLRHARVVTSTDGENTPLYSAK